MHRVSARIGGLLVVLAACAALVAPAATAAGGTDTYIVQLDDPPLASYAGDTRGIPATRPGVAGRPLDADSRAARRYRSHLASRQRAALDVLDAPPDVVYSYRTAFAGFSAELSEEDAARLRRAPQVARVWRDERRRLQQAGGGAAVDAALGGPFGEGPAYLRLPTGLWERLGGFDRAGEGVVVGVIDTGIWPEHPSFADDPAAGYEGSPYDAPEVWDGTCQGGERFATSACNDKLIGARYFVEGFGEQDLAPGSFLSPRDDDGHGSHTASTAAGNYGVDPVIDGNDLGVGLISGIAPRAHVAAYKVCWSGRTGDGCSNADTVAAIDAAVADGVDVINYSVGSDTSSVIGPDEIAFLGAADAGVFVANSAGNAGPGAGTVGSPTSVPWVTSVAASSLARAFEAQVTVQAGAEAIAVSGASVTRGLGPHPLVDGEAAGLPGVPAAQARGCLAGSLDPARVRGAIVLCEGNRQRAARARAVADAGGAGMILHLPEGLYTQLSDNHPIPAVHVGHADGVRIRALIAAGDARAEFGQARAVARTRGAVLADFSSRGPQAAVPDIAKPDVTAPGVQILAAAAPELTASSPVLPGQLFQAISGTSMSSPHVAGAAALLTQLHPLFTPAELKSALMTTADPDVLDADGTTPATALQAGSGEIDPNRAADPGLVLDVSTDDYLGYLEGVDPDIVEGDIPAIPATGLNLPSISGSRLVGTLTTSRTFRSVDARATRWQVEVTGLAGLRVTPSVRRFTIRPGERRRIGLRIAQVDAPLSSYAFGALVLRSGERRVRLPISFQPTAVAAPERIEITTSEPDGSEPLALRAGFGGTLNALGWGLAAPQTARGQQVTTTTQSPVLDAPDAGTRLYPVTVGEGTQLVASRITDADGGAEGTDLDLFLFRDPDGDGDWSDAGLVDFSAGPDSEEGVEVLLPEAGSYVWAVVGWATREPASTYDFTQWVADDPTPDDPEPAPGLVVAGDPLAVRPGQELGLSVGWSGVAAPGTYLGVVTYHAAEAPGLGNGDALSVVELVRE